jgi:endonuclease-3
MKVVPERYLRNAHHYLILHGRYTCIAKKPLCVRCPVYEPCGFKDKKKIAQEESAAEAKGKEKSALPKGRRV